MKKWKKYNRNNLTDRKQLYIDLNGKFPNCAEHLCGDNYILDGTQSGDIYVFYENEKPIVWIKYTPMMNTYGIGIDGSFGNYAAAKHLKLIIPKVAELDSQKKYINELTEDYNNYKKLLKLAKKEDFSNKELIFLYSQYNRMDTKLAENIINGKTKNHSTKRDCLEDYKRMNSLEEKSDFINTIANLNIKDFDNFKVNDAKPLINSCMPTHFMALKYTSSELLENEEFIIKAISSVNIDDHLGFYSNNLLRLLPSHYFGNSKVLSAAFISNPYIFYSIDHCSPLIKNTQFIIKFKEPTEVFSKAMKDLNFQEIILSSILLGCIKNYCYFKQEQKYFEKRIKNYFDENVIRNVINNFYGPFLEENENHEKHENFCLVKQSIKNFSNSK